MAIIRKRKSKTQRTLDAVKEGAEYVVKLRLAWAGGKTVAKLARTAVKGKTVAKVAAPAVAVGAAAAIAKRRGDGGREAAA